MENEYKGKVLEVIECMKDELINQLYMIKFDSDDLDYNGIENALCGKKPTGKNDEMYFIPKLFIVIQMKY